MDNKILQPMSKEQEDRVLVEVGYTREKLKEDALHIREWLEQQHHLPPSRLKETDDFIRWFLTGCKGNLEKVKKRIDKYYTSRNSMEIYKNRDPLAPEYVTVRSMLVAAVMAQSGCNGERLSIIQFSEMFDGSKYDYLAMCRIIFNITEVGIRFNGMNARMYIMIDCRWASPSIILKMKPSIISESIILLEKVLPVRIQKMMFIHAPSYVALGVNKLVKPFLSKKLQERLEVTTGGHEDIFNYFSPSILPRDYGGFSSNPSLKELNVLWMKYDQDNREWLLNELSERTDESKRIIIDKTPKKQYFGLFGSIKKFFTD